MQQPNETYQYQRLTASGLVKKGSGVLGSFIVASGTPTIKLTNDTAGTASDIILNTMQTAVGVPYPIHAQFTNGCFATISGTGDVTFLYN